MDKWIVFVDHDGERANTIFDDQDEAYSFAELLEKQSSFDHVFVRRFDEAAIPDSCKPSTERDER